VKQQITKSNERMIIGVLTKCTDGKWLDSDGLAPPDKLLVVGMTKALQCWSEQKPVSTIMETATCPLPDVDALNAEIPESEWEEGLDGKPRPPWQKNYVVYLLDPQTASSFTFANSTMGARIGFERLHDKFTWMRKLRGSNVLPLVRLEARPMKTKWGVKQRPEFVILEWRDFNSQDPAPMIEGPKLVEAPAGEPKPAQVERFGPAETRSAPAATPGKPVKPVSTSEAIDDTLPF